MSWVCLETPVKRTPTRSPGAIAPDAVGVGGRQVVLRHGPIGREGLARIDLQRSRVVRDGLLEVLRTCTGGLEQTPEFAVVDLRMPNGSGLELVRDLKTIDPATKVVVLTVLLLCVHAGMMRAFAIC